MYSNNIYRMVGVGVQNILISLYALMRMIIRDSRFSKEVLVELARHERSEKALLDYKNQKMSRALKNAIDSVPFYKTLDSSLGLSEFVYIDKFTVRNHPDMFRNDNYKGVVFSGATSGTTGTPLKVFQNKASLEIERAFANRQRAWAGYKKGDKRAWIRGDMIVPIEQKSSPFWRYSYFEDMILLSSFHMTIEALPLYIKAMVDYGVDIIQAYPSSIVTLAKYLESKNEYYPATLKSVLTSSESLSPSDKALVEKRFKCTVFDWYGLFERVAAIASCEKGRYHVLTDYAHVEFLDSGDGRHEIVGTNFNNTYYPLIRYKTGDYVVLSTETACPCGRVYPVVKSIEGRVGDYLIAEDGQKIHILNHIPKGIEGLLACQFIQDAFSLIKVLVVVNEEFFCINQEQHLIQNVKDRLGDSMVVIIQRVSALPRTKNGKVRQAICSIKDA